MHSSCSSSLEPSPLNANYKLEFQSIDKEVVASLYQDGKIIDKYTFTDLTPTQDWTYGTLPHLVRSKFDEFLTSRGIQVPLKRKRHVRTFVSNAPPPTAKTARSLFSQSLFATNPSNPSDNLEDPSSSMSSSSSHSTHALNNPAESIAAYTSLISRYFSIRGDTDRYRIHCAIFRNDLANLQKLCSLEEIKEEFQQGLNTVLYCYGSDSSTSSSSEDISSEDSNSAETSLGTKVSDKQITGHLKFCINNQLDYTYRITPLHIAVMTGNIQAAKILLNTGLCDPNVTDKKKLTPLHHAAALGNIPLIELLEENGADPEMQDAYGGTYQDILKQCHPELSPSTQSFYYQQQTQIVRGDAALFQSITGASLLDDEVVISFHDWFEDWKQACNESGRIDRAKFILTPFGRELKRRYLEFRQMPNPNKKFCLAFDPRVNHYLIAQETIPPFTIIGEYLGEINRKKWEFLAQENLELEKGTVLDDDLKEFNYVDNQQMFYNLEGINAFNYRGLMAMVASSFPNVICLEVRKTKGRQIRSVFITTEVVHKGEVLAFDYGYGHSVKRMPYCELRQNELEQFFREQNAMSLSQILDVQENDLDFENGIRQTAITNKVNYLLTTPSALLSLILKDVITVETVQLLFEQKKDTSQALPFMIPFFTQSRMSRAFFDQIFSLYDWMEYSEDHALVQAIKAELLAAIGTISTLDLYKKIIACREKLSTSDAAEK